MTDQETTIPPIVEATQAVMQTIATPTLPVLVEDMILVHKLAGEVQAALKGKHPSLAAILSSLLHGYPPTDCTTPSTTKC